MPEAAGAPVSGRPRCMFFKNCTAGDPMRRRRRRKRRVGLLASPRRAGSTEAARLCWLTSSSRFHTFNKASRFRRTSLMRRNEIALAARAPCSLLSPVAD
eukprot:9122969-Pyramimonas_sp.AAC.1